MGTLKIKITKNEKNRKNKKQKLNNGVLFRVEKNVKLQDGDKLRRLRCILPDMVRATVPYWATHPHLGMVRADIRVAACRKIAWLV